MFSKIKKSKTLRSVLGAASLFFAGAPMTVEAAPRAPQKVTQTSVHECQSLARDYMPLCEQLEGNVPYCYSDGGSITAGCGVHFKDFKSLENLSVLRITPKKGSIISLANKKRLIKMADADWRAVVTKAQYPEVEKVEIIKLKDCSGKCPKGSDKVWNQQLMLMPSETLRKMNLTAAEFFAQKAYEFHPNLFQVSPSVRFVVMDLIYNLGYNKYYHSFPKFREAVRTANLQNMKNECKSKNKRRDTVRECLINSALLSSQKTTKEDLFQKNRALVLKQNSKLGPMCEKKLWQVLDESASKDLSWCQKRISLKSFVQNKKESVKKS